MVVVAPPLWGPVTGKITLVKNFICEVSGGDLCLEVCPPLRSTARDVHDLEERYRGGSATGHDGRRCLRHSCSRALMQFNNSGVQRSAEVAVACRVLVDGVCRSVMHLQHWRQQLLHSQHQQTTADYYNRLTVAFQRQHAFTI